MFAKINLAGVLRVCADKLISKYYLRARKAYAEIQLYGYRSQAKDG